ncbi:MAG TPA: flagellar biosynthetic protein FliR [Polyangiaceae bacterium]
MESLPPPVSLLDALAAVFAASGVDPRAWALGFARSMPAVTLVPAFGLAGVPPPARVALGLALGFCLAPALSASVTPGGPLLVALAREALVGLPVALLAASAVYAASMAGGLIDDLRGARESTTLPVLPEGAPSVSVLFAMLTAVAFLQSGGAARVASTLAAPQLAARFSWPAVATALAASIEVAFAIAAPLAVAAVLLELGGALVARAATPAFIGPVLAPLRSVALLAVLALVFERVAELLALLAAAAP